MRSSKILLITAALVVGLTPKFWAEETKTDPGKVESRSKFATPMTDPEARWKMEIWSTAAGVVGNLDGPKMEILSRRGTVNYPFLQEGGPFNFTAYDEVNEQVIVAGGGARGYLDGPLSRARFGGFGYSMGGGASGKSPDGRFYVMGDGANKVTRLIDLQEQTVRTVPELAALKFFDAKGNAWLYKSGKDGNKLVSIEVSTMHTNQEIVIKEGILPTSSCVFDDANNRVYMAGDAFKRDGTTWYVSYLDLRDGGSFHGVLSGAQCGPGLGYAGSFDNFKMYPSGQHVLFGPDDPAHRFLYHFATDTGNFRKLDLEKRVVTQFDVDPKTGEGRFVETMPTRQLWAHAGPTFLPNGDFLVPGGREGSAKIFRRVK